jgi:hypothetical protein
MKRFPFLAMNLPMKSAAADVSPLPFVLGKVGADSRRLPQLNGSMREHLLEHLSRCSCWLRFALGVAAFACVSHLPAQMIPDALALQGTASGPGQWTEAGLGGNANYGWAVGLDGDTLVVGAPFHNPDPEGAGNDSGAAYVYRRANGVWSLEQQLQPNPGEEYVNFGWSVDVDGDTIVVGAYGMSDFNGGIYIFERDGASWTQMARRTATAGADHFGETVAVSGELVVAGHRADSSSRGAVHTFARNEGGLSNWGETVKLMAHDGANNDEFGTSLALAGDTLVVGAPLDDDKGGDSGSVYVYIRDMGAWELQQKLVAATGVANDRFGLQVSLDGDLVAVGIWNSGDNRDNIYLLRRDNNSWVEAQTVRVYTQGPPMTSLSLSGNALAVGIEESYPDGAAHLVNEVAGVWSLAKSFYPPEEFRRAYGTSVALDDDTLVIGDPREYRPGTNTDTGIVEVWAVDYANTPVLAGYVRKHLYHQDADDSVAFPKEQAAFRYKDLLFSDDAGLTYPDYTRMAGLWGSAEMERSRDAEELLLKFISRNNAPAYGNLLLDLYYDRAAAEIILAKERVALAEQDRLGPPLGRVPPASGFVIDNEIERYTEAGDKFQEALGRYFELFTLGLTVREPGTSESPIVWANSVIGVSSEWNPETSDWNAIQALGVPDTYPRHGDISTAWASATSGDQREFLELGFPATSPAAEIRIYETYNPGAVDLVQVRDAGNQTWHTVWTGNAVEAPKEARLLTVTFADPGFAIDGVRLELDSPAVPGWNEIDAVGITTQAGPEVEIDEPTFGYDLFRGLVPNRDLAPANVMVDGQPESVTGDDAFLFLGYRDLVMLYDLLKDYGRNARQLAWLHWANGNDATARELASESQRYLLVNGGVLDGIFPELEPEAETASGLDTAVAGYRAAVGDLTVLLAQIGGDSTPLGFDRNFLMLVQKFQGQDPELFDSFNSIKDWLEPTPASSQLRFARDRQAAAMASYATFRQNFDEVQEQFQQSTVSFEFRLFEIVGARPGEAGYDTPQDNNGSEIWQQMQSIDLARLRIRRNQAEIDNLHREISIEINRAADVQGVIIDYGNRQAKLTEEIGHLRAAQAAAQTYADAFSIEKLNPVNIFFNAVNAGVQTGGELAISQKEAQKERLAAGEKASIEGIESRARVQTLWLGMRTLVIDSQEAKILMKQETGRLAQLLREKNELERRLKERDANIARRYYADPIHRLNSNYDILVANLAFDAAHKWLFFMVRALEYKWNVPFAQNHGGVNWNAGAVFQCRNGEELYGLYLAMLDFDAQIEGTRIKDDFFDWFSVRDDFFGYRQLDEQGQPLTYLDAETGETVSGVEMFRRRLKRDFLDGQGPDSSAVQHRAADSRWIVLSRGAVFGQWPGRSATARSVSRQDSLDEDSPAGQPHHLQQRDQRLAHLRRQQLHPQRATGHDRPGAGGSRRERVHRIQHALLVPGRPTDRDAAGREQPAGYLALSGIALLAERPDAEGFRSASGRLRPEPGCPAVRSSDRRLPRAQRRGDRLADDHSHPRPWHDDPEHRSTRRRGNLLLPLRCWPPVGHSRYFDRSARSVRFRRLRVLPNVLSGSAVVGCRAALTVRNPPCWGINPSECGFLPCGQLFATRWGIVGVAEFKRCAQEASRVGSAAVERRRIHRCMLNVLLAVGRGASFAGRPSQCWSCSRWLSRAVCMPFAIAIRRRHSLWS